MDGQKMNTGSREPQARQTPSAKAPSAETPWRPAAGDFGQTAARRLTDLESGSVIGATVVLVVVVGIFHHNFLSVTQLKQVAQQASFIALMAVGMSFLLAMREIDLSVGSMFGLTLIIGAVLIRGGMNPWLAALVCIAAGAGLGLVNALLVQGAKIPAIIATLGTLSLYSGLAEALANGQQIVGLPIGDSFFAILGGNELGLPTSVWVLLIIIIVLTVVLRLTPFGYRVRAIGSNPDAATFSGISIPRVRVQALVLMGVLCGIAGVLGLAFYDSGDPSVGTGSELTAIAAAIIGGTALAGGTATVLGAAVGAILLGVVSSALVFFNVPLNWSAFATGAVIIVAVGMDSLLRQGRRRRRARQL
ncbi:MAG: ABC transporter permease [Streptosporangiaceae bacterium]